MCQKLIADALKAEARVQLIDIEPARSKKNLVRGMATMCQTAALATEMETNGATPMSWTKQLSRSRKGYDTEVSYPFGIPDLHCVYISFWNGGTLSQVILTPVFVRHRPFVW